MIKDHPLLIAQKKSQLMLLTEECMFYTFASKDTVDIHNLSDNID